MIRIEQDGDVARLALDRPERRNALSIADWESLAQSCDTLSARVLVVSGAGEAFCAGADLGEFPDINHDAAKQVRFREAMRYGLEAVRRLAIPTVAMVHGPCFGAGVALAMACDMRIASPAARFAITPAKMGIGYPQEDVARLVHLVGAGWASRMLFTAEPINAPTAERIGLVEGIGGEAEAEGLVAALLACDTGSIAMLKQGIRLAEAGEARDEGQDRQFDALMAAPGLIERLSQRRAARPLPPSGA